MSGNNKWYIDYDNNEYGWRITNDYKGTSYRTDCESSAIKLCTMLNDSEWISVKNPPELYLDNNTDTYEDYNVFCKHPTDSSLDFVTTLTYTEYGWTDGSSDLTLSGFVTHYKVLPKFGKGEIDFEYSKTIRGGV